MTTEPNLQERTIAELRRIMDAKGIHQAELGRRCNMTSSQLYLAFSGTRPNGVTLRTLERIADGLGVRLELTAVEVDEEAMA